MYGFLCASADLANGDVLKWIYFCFEQSRKERLLGQNPARGQIVWENDSGLAVSQSGRIQAVFLLPLSGNDIVVPMGG